MLPLHPIQYSIQSGCLQGPYYAPGRLLGAEGGDEAAFPAPRSPISAAPGRARIQRPQGPRWDEEKAREHTGTRPQSTLHPACPPVRATRDINTWPR